MCQLGADIGGRRGDDREISFFRQLEERARGKLERKNLDLIAANNLKVAGAGFGTDTNVITLIDKQQTRHLEQMSKEAAAMEILTVLRDMMK